VPWRVASERLLAVLCARGACVCLARCGNGAAAVHYRRIDLIETLREPFRSRSRAHGSAHAAADIGGAGAQRRRRPARGLVRSSHAPRPLRAFVRRWIAGCTWDTETLYSPFFGGSSHIVARLKWSECEPPSGAGCLAFSRLREVGTGNDAYVKGARGDCRNLKQRRELASLFPGGRPVRG